MNDNGLPHDPLSASQFNRPAMPRVLISLNANRSNGEFFPNIAGDFFRVEALDYPCRVSFNNGDFEQSIPLTPGMMLHGNFSGITLWHDNLSAANTTAQRLALAVGRAGMWVELDSIGTFNGVALPFLLIASTTTSRNEVIIPYGAHQLKVNHSASWSNATTTLGAKFNIQFVDINGVAITSPIVVRSGTNYSTTPNRAYTKYSDPVHFGATEWAYTFDALVDIPVTAERAICLITLSAPATAFVLTDFAAFAR